MLHSDITKIREYILYAELKFDLLTRITLFDQTRVVLELT
jgi:hypothetical protein